MSNINMPKKRAKLYYLSDADIPGRNARSIQEMHMCQSFVKCGMDVTHIHTRSMWEGKGTSWEEVVEHYGLNEQFELKTFKTLQNRIPLFPKIETLSMAGPIALYTLMNILSREIETRDVIYARNYYPAYFLTELKRLIPSNRFPPIVFEYHDTMDVRYQSRFFDIVDAVVCITQVLKEHTVEEYGIGSNRVFVAPDGVNLSRYQGWVQEEAREQLGLPDEEPLVVYTGHLYPGKGAEVLARAAEQIDGQIYIVGGYEEDVDRVQSAVPSYSNLNFTGFVNPAEIPPYQIAADVLVAPYTQEARRFVSPLKLFEYMAAGGPLVATDLRALREVLTDGENALLADPGDEHSLADKINTVLTDDDLADRLSNAASEDVTNYTWDQRAADILEYIGGLQSGR